MKQGKEKKRKKKNYNKKIMQCKNERRDKTE